MGVRCPANDGEGDAVVARSKREAEGEPEVGVWGCLVGLSNMPESLSTEDSRVGLDPNKDGSSVRGCERKERAVGARSSWSAVELELNNSPQSIFQVSLPSLGPGSTLR